jgi:hypothetical protein
MPFDKWGHPFFYPTKTNGFFFQMSDNPKSDAYIEGLDSDFSTSTGQITMNCNGPTSFSVGKNTRGFNGSIGGCNMDFAETAKRGYGYKADDVRDIEYKCVMRIDGIGDNGFSISVCTGRHTSSHCCQGFAYMANIDEPSSNPPVFRFRKEMWHVNYDDSPEGTFTHPKANFKLDGGGWFGYGICRYNLQTQGGNSPEDDNVVLEMWFNPTPESNANNWTMLKRIMDSKGNGWGDGGDDCGGDKDQVGVWSNAQNRLKTNATSGTVKFKQISFREIDPGKDFDETPEVPPPTGGGGSTVIRTLYYGAVSSGSLTGAVAYPVYGQVISHEIVETQTDADTVADNGWRAFGETNAIEIADDQGNGVQYPSGLWVDKYWSNSDNNNVAPGVDEVDKGSSNRFTYKGGPLLETPKVYLIFWGSEWFTRSGDPNKATVIDLIQNKLFGTNISYFSKLTQYNVGTPSWGGAVFNQITPIPTGKIGKLSIDKVLVDTFNTGLLPIPAEGDENIYLVVVPTGQLLTSLITFSNLLGWHSFGKFTLTLIPNPPGDPGGGGGGEQPTTPTKVTGSFTLQRDINVLRTSPCAGAGGGGGSGGKAKFYSAAANNDRALSDTERWKYRTRLGEKIKKKASSMNGKILKQLDVPLKKVGSPTASPTITAVIWGSNNQPIYTSPTEIDPSTLTTSFVKKVFDFSANTHVFSVGDIVGVRYYADLGSSAENYVVAGWEESTSSNSVLFELNNAIGGEKPDFDFACDMWD